jgi:hypothetical protein
MSHPSEDPSRPATSVWRPDAAASGGPAPWQLGDRDTVGTVPPARRRRGPLRWIVALLATALVATAGIGVALFAAGGQTANTIGASFLPSGSVAYVEGRLDLPGDQRENLVRFVGRFPGFADPSNFQLKIDETLDKYTREASDGRYVWSTDIRPWFEGEFAVGLLEWPEVDDLRADRAESRTGGTPTPRFVGALGIADRVALDAFLGRLRQDAGDRGVTFAERDHGGTTIVSAETESAAERVAYAATDDLFLFGMDAADVAVALDTLAGGPSLADDEAFAVRMAKLPEQRLGAFYMDTGAFAAALEAVVDEIPGGMLGGGVGECAFSLEQVPTAMAGALRVEGDRMMVDTRMVPGSRAPEMPVRDSGLDDRMPASTVAYVEQRDLGRTIRCVVEQVKTFTGLTDDQLRQIEEFLGTPVEDFLDWVADAGLAVALDGEHVSFGLVTTVTDVSVATQRIARLTAAINAAAVFGDVPFEVVDEQVAGATLTTVRLRSDSPMPLPPDLPIDPSLSWTVHDGRFVLGTSDFVRDVVERDPADGLASTEAYRTALDAAGGASNAGTLYVDVASIVAAAERAMPDESRAHYEREIRPYLAPLDRLIAVAGMDAEELTTRTLLFVR